jgi:hypothetical protein
MLGNLYLDTSVSGRFSGKLEEFTTIGGIFIDMSFKGPSFKSSGMFIHSSFSFF